MSCPCDVPRPPVAPDVPAGLSWVPRAVGGFSEFRAALLGALRDHPQLGAWRARSEADLGVMILEMWAYVCDVQAFYDEVHAQECYLRTAQRRAAVRRLVGLLGYRPRPAVAARARVAVLASGRQPIALPAGMAVRSAAFEDEPPQVFELEAETVVHPLLSSWELAAPRPATLATANPGSVLLAAATAGLRAGDLALVRVDAEPQQTQARRVASAAQVLGDDGATYVEVTFSSATDLAVGTPLAAIHPFRPTRQVGLWTRAPYTGARSAVDHSGAQTRLTLDGVHPEIRPGDTVVVASVTSHAARTVASAELRVLPVATGQMDIDGDGVDEVSVAQLPATRITLAGPKLTVWSDAHAPELTLHYAFQAAGTVTAQAATVLTAGDDLRLAAPAEAPGDGSTAERFQLEDKDGVGKEALGSLDLASGGLSLGPAAWDGALRVPVRVYGNVVELTRGETVRNEVLGSGDASLASQAFRLRRGPLTYVAAPAVANASGVRSTLELHAGGVRWDEAPSFFGRGGDERIYVVRHDDDGGTTVVFGDGLRGARLPTGRDNVVASYRYGAGAAAPPAGSITQIATALGGVASVVSPVPAFGGADAEDAAGMRTFAPRSALTLGRAVSIRDMEAVAAGVAGVVAVRAEWRWHGGRQRPVALLRFIGDAGIEATVAATVRAVSDPSTPIVAERAVEVPFELDIAVQIDERYVEDPVLDAVSEALVGDAGLLAPAHVGIGGPLFRSRLYAAVLGVEGAVAVTAVDWTQEVLGVPVPSPFLETARTPPAGHWFSLTRLLLNGQEAQGV